jgi:hypothetical protein
MYRHGTNELGFTIGGTEKAVLTSTTFTITPNLIVSGTGTINGTSIPASKTLVVTTDKLSALASTSSSELAGVITDETGTGALVFANTPTLVTPNIGAATGTSVNLSGAGTFGGNLTVSGTGGIENSVSNGSSAILKLTQGGYSTWNIQNLASNGGLFIGNGSGTAISATTGGSGGVTTIGGNLTVSGGGVDTAASTSLTLSGGSSGASLVLGQGTATLSSLVHSLSGLEVLKVQNSSVSGYSAISFYDNGGTQKGLLGYGNASVASGALASRVAFWANTGNDIAIVPGNSLAALFKAGGNLLIGTTTDATSGARLQAQLTGTDGTVSTLLSLRKNTNGAGTGVAIDFTPESTDTPLAKLSAVRTSQPNGYTDFRFSTWNGSALSEQVRLVGQTGNLLLGTTTDSGNGKLQLATHTTSAGGIGFGTDVSLYRSNTRELTFLGSGSSTFIFAATLLGSTVSLKLGDGTNNDQGIIESQGGSLVFKRNTTTALTLDSSQRCILAGALRLNNAYTAGAPTATGYVTIQDSAGNTYKVLVGT